MLFVERQIDLPFTYHEWILVMSCGHYSVDLLSVIQCTHSD